MFRKKRTQVVERKLKYQKKELKLRISNRILLIINKQTSSKKRMENADSTSITNYFYSSRSAVESSCIDDCDKAEFIDKTSNKVDQDASKSNLRKKVYQSHPKKLINERKGSTPSLAATSMVNNSEGIIKNSSTYVNLASYRGNFKHPSTTKNTLFHTNLCGSLKNVVQEQQNSSSTNNILMKQYLKLGYTTNCATSRNKYLNSTGMNSTTNSLLINKIPKDGITLANKKPGGAALKSSGSCKAFKAV